MLTDTAQPHADTITDLGIDDSPQNFDGSFGGQSAVQDDPTHPRFNDTLYRRFNPVLRSKNTLLGGFDIKMDSSDPAELELLRSNAAAFVQEHSVMFDELCSRISELTLQRQAEKLAAQASAARTESAGPGGTSDETAAPVASAPLRILCIDGGGIKGIIPAVLLSVIVQRCGQQLSALFDLVCGTSTGGLIALGTCCGTASVTDMLNVYLHQASSIWTQRKTDVEKAAGGLLAGLLPGAITAAAIDMTMGSYDHTPLSNILKLYSIGSRRNTMAAAHTTEFTFGSCGINPAIKPKLGAGPVGEWDRGGVLYDIATQSGTSEWVNPHAAGRVTAAWSSSQDFMGRSSASSFVSGPCEQPRWSVTKGVAGSWMRVDLGPLRRLAVRHYALRTESWGGGLVGNRDLRSWELQGASHEEGPWVALRRHVRDETLDRQRQPVGAWGVAASAVEAEVGRGGGWRFLRVVQTGPNAYGNHELSVSGVEFWGTLSETAELKSVRVRNASHIAESELESESRCAPPASELGRPPLGEGRRGTSPISKSSQASVQVL